MYFRAKRIVGKAVHEDEKNWFFFLTALVLDS